MTFWRHLHPRAIQQNLVALWAHLRAPAPLPLVPVENERTAPIQRTRTTRTRPSGVSKTTSTRATSTQQRRRRWGRAEYRSRLEQLVAGIEDIEGYEGQRDALGHQIAQILTDTDRFSEDDEHVNDLADEQESSAQDVRQLFEEVHAVADEISDEVERAAEQAQPAILLPAFNEQLAKLRRAKRALFQRRDMDTNWQYRMDGVSAAITNAERQRRGRGWVVPRATLQRMRAQKRDLIKRKRVLDAVQHACDEELRTLCKVQAPAALLDVMNEREREQPVAVPLEVPEKPDRHKIKRDLEAQEGAQIRAEWAEQQRDMHAALRQYTNRIQYGAYDASIKGEDFETFNAAWFADRRNLYDFLEENRPDFLAARRKAMAIGLEPIANFSTNPDFKPISLELYDDYEEGWSHYEDDEMIDVRLDCADFTDESRGQIAAWESTVPTSVYENRPPEGEYWQLLGDVELGETTSLYEPMFPPKRKIREWRVQCDRLREQVRAEYERRQRLV